jgi:hypothetical protein
VLLRVPTDPHDERATKTRGTVFDILSGRRMLDGLAILQDLHSQAPWHHRIENRQERPDVIFRVNDFDDERQVLAPVEDFHAVQPGRMAEAHRAAK